MLGAPDVQGEVGMIARSLALLALPKLVVVLIPALDILGRRVNLGTRRAVENRVEEGRRILSLDRPIIDAGGRLTTLSFHCQNMTLSTPIALASFAHLPRAFAAMYPPIVLCSGETGFPSTSLLAGIPASTSWSSAVPGNMGPESFTIDSQSTYWSLPWL